MTGADVGIVVFGSINVDVTAQVEHLPRRGETMHGTALAFGLGGKGANQAVAARRLGAPVSMIGRVGEDAFADLARTRLAAHGVGTGGVRAVPGAATGTALIAVAADGANTIVVVAGANAALDRQAVAAHQDQVATAQVLLLQLETPAEAIVPAAALVHQRGGLVVLDPAPCPPQGIPSEVLAAVDVVTPNEVEAETMTGIACRDVDGARRAGQVLLDAGALRVVIKLGARGALLMTRSTHGGHELLLPALPVDAIDTVAAGDCFNAGLAVALAEGRDWPQALALANAAGALSTTRRGAAESAPTRDEVEALLAAASNGTR